MRSSPFPLAGETDESGDIETAVAFAALLAAVEDADALATLRRRYAVFCRIWGACFVPTAMHRWIMVEECKIMAGLYIESCLVSRMMCESDGFGHVLCVVRRASCLARTRPNGWQLAARSLPKRQATARPCIKQCQLSSTHPASQVSQPLLPRHRNNYQNVRISRYGI